MLLLGLLLLLVFVLPDDEIEDEDDDDRFIVLLGLLGCIMDAVTVVALAPFKFESFMFTGIM